MTKRLPPGTSFESWIDQQVRAAREAGEFDDLPGAGKPLADLDEVYDPAWWLKQWLRRENVSVLPRALELRASVEKALAAVIELRSEDEVRARLEALNAEIRRVNATTTSGPATGVSPLDVEEILRDYRRRRAGGV